MPLFKGLESRSDVSLASETARRGREKFSAENLLVTKPSLAHRFLDCYIIHVLCGGGGTVELRA
jgi:hypothetical protein